MLTRNLLLPLNYEVCETKFCLWLGSPGHLAPTDKTVQQDSSRTA